MKFSELRDQFPVFSYVSAQARVHDDAVIFSFEFRLGEKYIFHPTTTIRGIAKERLQKISPEHLEHFAFHAGLAEIFSYWKLACSPEIRIEAGFLSGTQIDFWKNLLVNGMGEFFYVNDIDFTVKDFVRIVCDVSKGVSQSDSSLPVLKGSDDTYLIPLGGGKDSIVTAELLKRFVPESDRVLFSVNPTTAEDAVAEKIAPKKRILVDRVLDPLLFDLNAKGFFNGHTPFSSVLAFLSTISGFLAGFPQVAISQERSSNEGNILFRGAEVNHQYSKSFDFEKRFREYVQEFLCQGVNFFSMLRPLYEIQIAKIFSTFPKYFSVFRSCNRGQKTNSWCGMCPKCLFTFMALFPFVEENILVDTIFGKNLFENSSLESLLRAFVEKDVAKPFECIGTREESIVLLHLAVRKYGNRKLPALLDFARKNFLSEQKNTPPVEKFLHQWNEENFVPQHISQSFLSFIKSL